MWIDVFFRKIYYSIVSPDKECRKRVRELMNVKVRSPFDSDVVLTLGDLLVSTAINEYEIIQIAKSYGIVLPSEAVDLSGNSSLQYLLYHGKKFHYIYNDVTVGIDKIGDTEIISGIPLIPNSHLDSMIKAYEGSGESIEQFYGHALEHVVNEKLNALGIESFIPASSNTPGYDILCNREEFFKRFGINLPECKDNPEMGLLQVKSTIGDAHDFTGNTLNHFSKYSDIPVVCSDKIYENLPQEYTEKCIRTSCIGINDIDLEKQIKYDFDIIKRGDVPDVPQGIECSHFDDYTSDFHFPWIAAASRAAISGWKNYRMYSEGIIDVKQGAYNIGRDVTRQTVISGTTAVATGFICDNLNLSLQDSVNDITENFFLPGDCDLGDVCEDFAEIAVVLCATSVIASCAKKAWRYIFGDPFEQLKALIRRHKAYVLYAGYTFKSNSSLIIQRVTPVDYTNVTDTINTLAARMQEQKDKRFKPMEFFVFEYKKEQLEGVRAKYDEQINSFSKAMSRIAKLYDIDDECRFAQEDSLDALKTRVQEIYLNKQEINQAFKKVKSLDALADFITAVLTAEIKNVTAVLKNSDLEFIEEIEKTLNDYEIAIKQEKEKLKREGHL
ncbi:hypothetical protein [Phascolarctobacterium sp.]|uniref:hypothetical protein n=1 Tax=Phascolarctobacterium sp. TaxID=2049039 RepID=UPI00386A0B8F